MKFNIGSKSIALVFVALLATSGIAAAAGGTVDWSSDPAPNIELAGVEQKDVHKMEWGTSETALEKYEDNSGDIATMDKRVNTSNPNPVSLVPTDINESDLSEFPHDKSDVSALEASEWSVGGSNSAKGSVSNTETAPGVDAVQMQTDGSMTSGDSVTYTFSNFSIDADEAKHFLSAVQDVETLDSGTVVQYEVTDEDGDTKVAEINTSRSSGEDFMANETGEGFVYQRQLGNMETTGSGDGDFNNIESLTIQVQDGDASVVISGLNLDKMSTYDFGTTTVDADENEQKTWTEKKTPGAMELSGIDTLGATFEDADLHNIEVDMVSSGADQPDENVYLNLTETDKYPGYHGTATIAVRFDEPDAYDLQPSNLVLRDTQSVTSDRLISVRYAEGVSGDEPVDRDFLESQTWTKMTGQYGDEGTEVTLDSSMQSGSTALAEFQFKLTEGQFNAIKQANGGGGGTGAQGGGGLGSIPIIGGVLVALLGLLKGSGG